MKNMRYLAEAFALWFAFLIFRALPYRKASALGGWIGRTVGPRLAASRKAYKNLSSALPGKNEDEYQTIVRDMWDNLGRVIAEYPHLEEITNEIEITGTEHLEGIPDQVVIIGAHMANWELLPTVFNVRLDMPMTGIYRAPNNPYSEKLLEKCRTFSDKGVYTPKSSAGSRTLIKTIQDGGRIGILIDQKYNQGLQTNFFGLPAMTSPSFIQLARKYNCPILPLWIERVNGSHFRAHLEKPFMVGDRSDEDVLDYTHGLLESQILKNPGQWLWLHRRWMT